MAVKSISVFCAVLLALSTIVLSKSTSSTKRFTASGENGTTGHSLNVSSCPGYTLSSVNVSETGLTAYLKLAGNACDAFGSDVDDLTLQVTYDTNQRLRVNIFDTAKSQFTIPPSVISLPPAPTEDYTQTSDLVFNYESSPFAFWITRRSEPDTLPLFDTRISSLPPTPIPPLNSSDPSTALDGFPLVFEDQYLQLTSALPYDANIYGLGEVIASSGFRRDVGTADGLGTIQTMWARDDADPVNENMYGSHPIYMEHRYNETSKKALSHGVFHFSAAGSDTLLATPPSSPVSLIQYRAVGGTLDFYFFSGPSPQDVIEQYGKLIGLPTWQPVFGLGFHLCRWGYTNISETMEQVTRMREANIPLEVMWNDIDLYHALRDFTTDPVSYPSEEVRAFIQELAANHQHYIPIVDAAIAKQVNSTDIYDPYTRGVELDVWLKNPDGSEYVGQVWPGYTVFPDWFSDNAEDYWTEALSNWSQGGVEFSGIWLDMNEVSSFCNGSCGSGADLSTPTPEALPGQPGNLVTAYPEGYNASVWGPSGNITINGTLTYGVNERPSASLTKRGVGAGEQPGVNLNFPPYAIHNGFGPLYARTLDTNATHVGGYVELDVHNMFGLMEERATHLAVQKILDIRPFLISRSTFPSTGKWSGHWLGDNYSKWSYMHYNIQGVLQFQVFQIPMVGADTCGFNGNTDEELCNRWMQLSAFMPFYRNHNEMAALPQEPYRWDSVANASRTAIGIRYSLLPYWYTLFANSSTYGSPVVRALFYEFPDEPELFAIDRQYLIGRDVLVTPVLTPNVSTVDGIFPGRGQVVWRDWYTHQVINATASGNTTIDAPLGHIPVHIRDGSAILLYAAPAYTIEETRQGPYSLLVSLSADGTAFGTAYIDDGFTVPPTPNTTLTFIAVDGTLSIKNRGDFLVNQTLDTVTILGASETYPDSVAVRGQLNVTWSFKADNQELVVTGLNLDLNNETVISWM
ncbi:glycoside hydrolase family 31 protein [Daedalea quercina L-15889]|uniref:Glycoside hydrolase family 31 protein n=1 Tax=Daedalea quercina L-15889 TaxID=1314783 RepID=A0A165PQB6_9APHY|nr:glycoside hydrolase family 31 protein [Daedalea quercina L-15889]